MHVCSDRVALPNYDEHPVVGNQADLTRTLNQATMGNMEREVLCGITLWRAEAERLYTWLGAQIKNIKDRDNG